MKKLTLLVITALALFGVAVGEASAQATALYRYEHKTSKELLLSATPWELGNDWQRKETLGLVYTEAYANVVPVYRYNNPTLGDHYYTTNYDELKGGAQGWNGRGIGFYAFKTQVAGTIPLYYYNNSRNIAFFTTNKSEGDSRPGYWFGWVVAYIYPPNAGSPSIPSNPGSGPVVVGVTPGQGSNPGSGPSVVGVTPGQSGSNPGNPGGPSIVPSTPSTPSNPSGPTVGGTSRGPVTSNPGVTRR